MSRRGPSRWPFAAVAVAAVVVAAVLVWSLWFRGGSETISLSLGELQSAVADGNVAEATILDRSNTVSGTFADGAEFTASYPAEYSPQVTQLLLDGGVQVETDPQPQSIWMNLLFQVLPILLLGAAFLVAFIAIQKGSLFGMNKAKARRLSLDDAKVTFGDVAGCEEAVEDLKEIRDFLKDPDRFHALGASIPRGVLLYGPPGTGKTLLARAVAGEAGVPFFSLSGSDFVEVFGGLGASRVRDLFQQARSSAPAIVFVDEIDAVGRQRGANIGGGNEEGDQTLNQLLVEMDGFEADGGVLVVAATNRPDILDPALLRPGRFDRQIMVDRPDRAGRRKILEVHARGKPMAGDVDLDLVAGRTPGFTGADLSNTLNEAAILATRRGGDVINRADVEAAIERVMAGPERKSRVMSDREKKVIAYHEAGHALVGHVLPTTDPIHKVSIVARGQALGWTLALPTEERHLKSRSQLRDEMTMLLGGRTSEELVFGDPTTGAADDLERATTIARSMVLQMGMSESLGLQQFGRRADGVSPDREMELDLGHSDELTGRIDAEIRRFLDEAHSEAMGILTAHRPTLDRLAEALVEQETLGDEALEEILGGTVATQGATSP